MSINTAYESVQGWDRAAGVHPRDRDRRYLGRSLHVQESTVTCFRSPSSAVSELKIAWAAEGAAEK